MKLERIEVANFKGLREAEFAPGSFTCLVGENNAGKSSVLQTIVYALNRPTELPRNVYYDETKSITFRCSFDDIIEEDLGRLAEEHRARIAPLIYEGRLTIVVSFRCSEKADIRRNGVRLDLLVEPGPFNWKY